MKPPITALAIVLGLVLAGPAATASPPARKAPASPAAKKKLAAPAAAKKPAPAAKPRVAPAAAPAESLPERTDALFVTPPEGWVVSGWSGGTVELGGFSPPGKVGAAYVDLLGYSLVPRLPGSND